jgi:biopolymer transport protein ExbB
MKKLVLSAMVTGALFLFQPSFSQNTDSTATEEIVDSLAVDSASTDSTTSASTPPSSEEGTNTPSEEELEENIEPGFNQVIKEKMSQGGLVFMSIVLVCLILGLIICVERIITLAMSTTNTKDLLNQVKGSLKSGDLAKTKDLCARTKGPIASIFAQGLIRSEFGLDAVQTSIENYGASEMGKLEKGLTWISLFIALAPMFGFMGTVLGMIGAFDSIEGLGEIQIDKIAGDIKVALLTTVAGLIVAVILQFFYNFIVSKIDAISGDMEDASNEFIDMLIISKNISK